MIIETIYSVLADIVMAVYNVLPTIPPIPEAVEDGGQWLIDAIQSSVGLLTALFTAPLLGAAVFIIVSVLAFEPIYHTTLWVLKKIPMINIK